VRKRRVRTNRTRKQSRIESPKVNQMCGWLREMGFSTTRERTFRWLRNPRTGANLYLDIYIPALKIAIEYDGPTHFRVCKNWGMTESTLRDQKQRDRDKDRLCLEHGIRVVRFSCQEKFSKALFLNRMRTALGKVKTKRGMMRRW
jgi:very-short-patch-repair endonuclease